MALRAVIDHPKFTRLKALLSLNKSCTLGYLEALWHFTGRYTQQGNVGKYSDEEIEAWLEWDGLPGVLIAAMIEARWVDRDGDPENRLLIHDWEQHADKATKLALSRAKLEFIVPTVYEQCTHTESTGYTHAGIMCTPPVPVPVPGIRSMPRNQVSGPWPAPVPGVEPGKRTPESVPLHTIHPPDSLNGEYDDPEQAARIAAQVRQMRTNNG